MPTEFEQIGSLGEALFILAVVVGVLIYSKIKEIKNKDKGDNNE